MNYLGFVGVWVSTQLISNSIMQLNTWDAMVPLSSQNLIQKSSCPSLSHSRNPNSSWCRERNLFPLRFYAIKHEIFPSFAMQCTSLFYFYPAIVSNPGILHHCCSLMWFGLMVMCDNQVIPMSFINMCDNLFMQIFVFITRQYPSKCNKNWILCPISLHSHTGICCFKGTCACFNDGQ